MERLGLEERDESSRVEYVEAPVHMREHLDMAGIVSDGIRVRRMPDVKFSYSDVMEQLGKLKRGKQSGPDELKPEIYKWLMGNRRCVELLTHSMNRVIVDSEPPNHWRESRTSMIPKKQKPKYNEL